MKKNKKIIISIVSFILIAFFGINISDLNIETIYNEHFQNQNIATELPDSFKDKKVIKVDPCNLSGDRKANVLVDIGYDDREYYAITNEYKQLTEVYIPKIQLQKRSEENESGRYCPDEAKVDGVQSSELDEGHVIADSLGGVSNAYNITPQDSYTNREGEQANFEEEIRKSLINGKLVSDFHYYVKYDNNKTMIPSNYKVEYKINNTNKYYTFENK